MGVNFLNLELDTFGHWDIHGFYAEPWFMKKYSRYDDYRGRETTNRGIRSASILLQSIVDVYSQIFSEPIQILTFELELQGTDRNFNLFLNSSRAQSKKLN